MLVKMPKRAGMVVMNLSPDFHWLLRIYFVYMDTLQCFILKTIFMFKSYLYFHTLNLLI